MSFPDLPSLYDRAGIYRGSASFQHNGSVVGQNGATQKPIGGRPLFDGMPRHFKTDPGSPLGAGVDIDRSFVGKPAPCGGQQIDRRGVAHMNTHQLLDTLRQESLVKSSVAAYGGSVLGARYGAEGGNGRMPDPPGFGSSLSGRFAPLYDLPPTGGALSDQEYVEAFHDAFSPIQPSIQREMIEIHRADMPIGGDRWAHMQRAGAARVPQARQTEISHLAW